MRQENLKTGGKEVKKYLVLMLALSIVVGTSILHVSAGANVVKIGVGLPLTGASAEQGMQTLRGVQLYVEQINAKGGINGIKVEVLPLDDKADPKEAANVANKFAADPDVIAVVGHNNSSCTLAAAPVYEKAGVISITTNASSPLITNAGPYTFRLWNSDTYTVNFLLDAGQSKGYKKFGMVYENNDYGRGGYAIFETSVKSRGLTVSYAEAYMAQEMKDFSTMVTKFKFSGTEVVYLQTSETDAALVMLQAKQMDYHPFFIGPGLFNQTILDVAGDAADNSLGFALYNPSKPPQGVLNFNKEFLAKFSKENITVVTDKSLIGYMAAQMICESAIKGGVDRKKVMEYISVNTFKTPLGDLKFDVNGDIHFPLALMKPEKGKFVQAN